MKISIKREQNDARIGYAERKTFRTQFKIFKLFSMAALALMMAACSSEDNEIATAPKTQGVKFTATISTSNSGATRALSENGNTIEATWAKDEEVELIYTIGGTTYQTRARVTAVTDGKATIEAELATTPTEDTPVTLIYPAVVANGTTGNVLPDLLLRQEGTLANIATTRDVRKGTGTLISNGNTATLKEAVTMTNQYAIWKITTPASANELCIMADNTPIASALMYESGTVFYVAVPAVSSKTITVVATDESNNCYYYTKTGVSLATSKYYKSDLSESMTTLYEDNNKSVYKITGILDESATIPAGRTVVFSGVNINGGNITCSGNATIILMGMNSVTNGAGAGIQAGGLGTTLTITGTGSLTATGYGGAGIGACDNATCGNIVISGGEIMATGNNGAAGIGTGYAISGNSTCGNILISGGTVMAAGGYVEENGVLAGGGAGIGAGFAKGGNTTCGTITITSGVTEVMAAKGIEAANSIGAGTTSGEFSSTCGTVTIEDGANVTQF